MICHFKQTEDGFTDDGLGNLTANNQSSCYYQTRWDFSDSANSGKWSSSYQAYRMRPYFPSGASDTFDYGQVVVTTKNKIRGSGRALSLKFTSEEGKDFHMYGLSILYNGRSAI